MTELAPIDPGILSYHMDYPVTETRERLEMLTGMPAGSTAETIAVEYIPVFRKMLGRGTHIKEVLVWNPDPDKFEFPTKEQASLMDGLAKREHISIPVEVESVSEDTNGNITITYRTTVTEEQLLAEEDRKRLEPGAPTNSEILAASPVVPFALGAVVSGAIGYGLMPKKSPALPRFLVMTAMGLIGGVVTVGAIRKIRENEEAVA